MLTEYALIPDVFDPDNHASTEACDKCLRELKEGIISRGLVRNLHGGGWWNFVEKHRDRWHMRGKELLKKLKQQGRLCTSLPCADELPENASAWCAEALASHAQAPLGGIVADETTAANHATDDEVAPVSKLAEQTWWLGGKNSIELKRTTEAYLQALGPTLLHSNLIMLIDPHLDPTSRNYSGVADLLKACGPRKPNPMIQIHRVCGIGSGRERQFPSIADWKQRFESALGQTVRQNGLNVEVFLWDDFHDRYLISNLIGILMPNGFDTDSSITRWARLDREHRDSVEKEFDPPSSPHALDGRRFKIGT